MIRTSFLIALLFFSSFCFGDLTTFTAKIRRHKSAEKRLLVDKVGTLSFDDGGKLLTFKDGSHDDLKIQYDAVTKVVFDETTHMRGRTASAVAAQLIPYAGMVAAPAIAGHHVQNYWFYIEYKDSDQLKQVLLELPHESSRDVVQRTSQLFGSKVIVADYQNNRRSTLLSWPK